MGLICSALTLVAIPLVPGIYHIKGETMAYCRQLMYVMAFILPFMELQSMNMMGLLRGGGDVKIPDGKRSDFPVGSYRADGLCDGISRESTGDGCICNVEV